MKRTVEQLVRSAFAGEGGVRPERLAALKELAAQEARKRSLWRRGLRFGVPSLLAASLALVLSFDALWQEGSPRSRGTVKDAIGLLCEIDGISKEEFAGKTAGEMLLAWQEAPCRGLL